MANVWHDRTTILFGETLGSYSNNLVLLTLACDGTAANERWTASWQWRGVQFLRITYLQTVIRNTRRHATWPSLGTPCLADV